MYSAALRNSSGTMPGPALPRPNAAASGCAKNTLPATPSSIMNAAEIRVQAANSCRGSAPAGGSW